MRIASVCLALLCFTGCSDSAVRQYAAQLAAQLSAYRAQLEQNLQAERRMYSELAAVFATEAERDLYENLSLERLRTASSEARRLETTSDPFDEQEHMRQRMLAEFDATREFYLQEMTLPEQTTAGLRSLEYNSQKLAALAAALDPFTRRPELGALARDIDEFRTAATDEMKKQRCRDLAGRAAITRESFENAREQKASNVQALKQKLDKEEALSSQCPTN
jgi:hypothetical protein